MRRRPLVLAALLLVIAPASSARAQLRPLDPVQFDAFDSSDNFYVTAGVGILAGQRAALAGTRGRLTELGLYSIAWRSDRIVIRASGTAYMRMSDETQVEPSHPGVETPHADAGPVILETTARLSPQHAPVLMLLRFGSRLPVTSLRSGLERDEADFFASLGFRSQGDLWVAGEAGTSINGRPEPTLGQTDVVMFSLGSGYRGARLPVLLDAWLVGHDDLHDRRIRGNEDLRELRIGARTRGELWLGAQWIHGLGDFSPDNGLRITAGFRSHLDHVPVLGWH
jgi:hypothetical protein